jgi:hypothetical protein
LSIQVLGIWLKTKRKAVEFSENLLAIERNLEEATEVVLS